MNHLHPVQHQDGGWHYGSSNRRSGIHAIGYCRDHPPHATEDEARECYGKWLRDHVRVGHRNSSGWNDCQAPDCDQPAKNIADVEGDGYRMAVLCDDHNNVEQAIAAMHLDGPAGDAWQS